jgi:hypothetical protein
MGLALEDFAIDRCFSGAVVFIVIDEGVEAVLIQWCLVLLACACEIYESYVVVLHKHVGASYLALPASKCAAFQTRLSSCY